MQTKSAKNEERTDFIIGITVVAIVLALLVWFAVHVSIVSRRNAAAFAGEISVSGECVRGSEQTFTFVPDGEVADGATIEWTVDGKTALKGVYSKQQPVTFCYTADTSGEHVVAATVGKYAQKRTVNVAAPRLTIAAPNVTIVYGEQIAPLLADVEGFVGAEANGFFCENCVVEQEGKLNVGVYRILAPQCQYLDYETERVDGILTVLPRTLSVEKIVKVYDGTSYAENPQLQISGAKEGDEVYTECDRAYFDNKNAGMDKTVTLSSVTLAGKDACNYILPDFAEGSIAPKAVFLRGLSVQNKVFDGTTKATVDKTGHLDGVCEGDIVTIGKLEAKFDGAEVGAHDIVTEISLVGADKDNYVLAGVHDCQAQIEAKGNLWDKIFNREPVAQGNK